MFQRRDVAVGDQTAASGQSLRSRATLVLRKAADHSVRFVRLRKL